ncbi:unnamed protein product, partial [Discosporangium mesarthrocarpum]
LGTDGGAIHLKRGESQLNWPLYRVHVQELPWVLGYPADVHRVLSARRRAEEKRELRKFKMRLSIPLEAAAFGVSMVQVGGASFTTRQEQAFVGAKLASRCQHSAPRIHRRQRPGMRTCIVMQDGSLKPFTKRGAAAKKKKLWGLSDEEGQGLENAHFVLEDTTLLTHEEEICLGRQVQTLMAWKREKGRLEEELGREVTEDEWASAVGVEGGVVGLRESLLQ